MKFVPSVISNKKNIIFIILALCLIASAVGHLSFGNALYYSGLIIIMLYELGHAANGYANLGLPFLLFGLCCVISSIVNWVFDPRLLAFLGVIICATPILYSRKIDLFRRQYLVVALAVFPILSLVNLYCYYAGINYFEILSIDDINELDFSGLFPNPMWLAAAVGIANTVLIWSIFTVHNKILKALFTFVILLSFFLSVISASRSALFASLVVVMICIFLYAKTMKRKLVYVSLILLLGIAVAPIYLKNSERIQMKNENTDKYGSRTALFEQIEENVNYSPIVGVGFAGNYHMGKVSTGRTETGSGWLSILSQTGIAGFALILFLTISAILKVFPYVSKGDDQQIRLFFLVFIFLCIHSLFEGYLLTVGYYPCILFWLLLGYLYSYSHVYSLTKNTDHVVWEGLSKNKHFRKIIQTDVNNNSTNR
ncbi:MAG: O-antigen ligase family protein [Prevotella sp.]|jgi:O-antigen ligase|nr:O-antigen ligase family protein [Prevotella sp.]MCI2080547.1 O-antigen ligase family protein [Prevotella sp.]MCI2102366.1 O-antigen ligase family protein [Prevotella sp.]